MEITLEKKDTTNATIKINLNQDDYRPRVAEKLKEYSKKANIKGFRPGKVPASLIEKMYGKSIMVDEINSMLSESVTGYIKENELPVVGDPLPDVESAEKIDWENQSDFEFSYKIGLVSEFKPDIEAIKATHYKISVSDKEVDETIENLRTQHGKMTNPEESKEGDSIYGELKEKNGDFTTTTLIPLSKVEKGELKKFIGVKKDDTISFDIRKAFADSAAIAHVTGLSKEEAEKKEGTFEFTVQNVNRQEPADLDQEFFDKIVGQGTVSSEEEFKAKVKELMNENFNKEGAFFIDRQIQDQLVENTNIELPDEFLKDWLFHSNKGKFTKEQIENEFDAYKKELKWSLIKNKLGKDNELKVEHEDVIKKSRELFMQQLGGVSIGDDNPEMNETLNKIAENYLQQEDGKNYYRVFDQAYNEKIFEYLKGKVKIEEKETDSEGFKKAVEK
ncbi:trigger factor [Cytophagaceae bacterium ABcell3]|nr:trigger factor [Cytophagaceae bacterium ABcell3]